ncbi:MAG: type III secretion inner membrane ring lipoprotein SctJ, partial [Planctomycetota bacterium]
VGCSKVGLYSNLPEREANEMMAVLMRSGIACAKEPGDEQAWNLSVATGDFGRSVEILKQLGYPRENFDDMGQMFQKSGLVSSPSEERIRFMHALSEELSQTISDIDGVLTARVHIVLPNNNPFGEEVQPSSAAVFIKHRPEAELDLAIAKIKQLVLASIEGLGPDNVTVALFPADSDQLDLAATTPAPLTNVMSLKIAPESVNRLWAIVGGAIAIGVVGIAIGLLSWLKPPAAAKAG